MKEFWDTRYAANNFVYGEIPNQFFKETLDDLNLKGSILLPAEGEGRNAIYAAKKKLQVFAFDISKEGKNKAEVLAKKNKVAIKYEIGSIENLNLKEETFDVLGLIFAHFSAAIKSDYHKKLISLIKPNGIVIFEAFSKKHLPLRLENPKAGGPNNIDMLFSKEEIKNDFKDFEILQLEEVTVTLNEGDFHNGKSKVIRFIGRKK